MDTENLQVNEVAYDIGYSNLGVISSLLLKTIQVTPKKVFDGKVGQ